MMESAVRNHPIQKQVISKSNQICQTFSYFWNAHMLLFYTKYEVEMILSWRPWMQIELIRHSGIFQWNCDPILVQWQQLPFVSPPSELPKFVLFSKTWYSKVKGFLIRTILPSTKSKPMRNALSVAKSEPPL